MTTASWAIDVVLDEQPGTGAEDEAAWSAPSDPWAEADGAGGEPSEAIALALGWSWWVA